MDAYTCYPHWVNKTNGFGSGIKWLAGAHKYKHAISHTDKFVSYVIIYKLNDNLELLLCHSKIQKGE